MSVAAVVPCHNEASSILDLLNALARQTVIPTEIVVIDDGSTDGSADVVRSWHTGHPAMVVRVVAGPGRGPGAAMNAGIVSTQAEVIVRLDGHSVPCDDYIERTLALVADPRVGVAGGAWQVIPGASTTVGRAIAAVVVHPLGSGGAHYRRPDSGGAVTTSVETVPFGTFRRAVWEQLGGFDEALPVNEDFDFNYRARLAGYDVVFDRRVTATYIARPTLATLSRQYLRYGFWKRQMLRKTPRALHWRQVPPILLLPVVVSTGVLAALWPSLLAALLAGLYPAALAGGAVQMARRGISTPAAFAALLTLQLSWSGGFWRAMLGGRPPGR